LVALLTINAWAGFATGAEHVSVEASSHGAAVEVIARATIRAPYALIWQTLTDYDHLAEFIPGMVKSHVIGRRGSAAIVEQSGKAAILFFSYPIEVVVESFEQPPTLIGIRVIKGNLKQLDGGYRLEKIAGQRDAFVLHWSGYIEPSLPVPLFITVPLMRSNISDQFRGMVAEIERRETLRVAKQDGK
jgi:ribosome-associated toxin RatA of RatAB toxin-antitoxin module